MSDGMIRSYAVLDNPNQIFGRFILAPDSTGDPETDGWARRRNGDVRRGFMRDLRRRYPM